MDETGDGLARADGAEQSFVRDSRQAAPPDLDALRPFFARIARLAQAAADVSIAQIEIQAGDEVWRIASGCSASPSLTRLASPPTQMIWIEDLLLESRARNVDDDLMALGARLFASAPIQRENGAHGGVLSLIDLAPRPYDPQTVERLKDLAELTARECDRTLPAVKAAPEPAALRVLLAEDHPINRKMVEVILEMIGVDLTSVETGQAALAAFKVSAFDLVLMDLQMPVMDGLTAIRAIRALERDSGGPPTPIYALTASAMADQIEASRLAGADAHLVKPITPAHLIAAVRAVGQPDALEAAQPPTLLRRAV